jgi:hypothetical protein
MNAGTFGIAAALALALPGCAGVGVQADWEERPTHPELPAYHVEVPAADLPRVCGSYPGMVLHGCALRVVEARACLIYTAPGPAAWLMEHERKHCAGWDHGPRLDTRDRRAAAASPLSHGKFQ